MIFHSYVSLHRVSVCVTRHAMISRFQFSFVVLVPPLSNSHKSPVLLRVLNEFKTSLNWTDQQLWETSANPGSAPFFPEDSAQTASSTLGLGNRVSCSPVPIILGWVHSYNWPSPRPSQWQSQLHLSPAMPSVGSNSVVQEISKNLSQNNQATI